jgi:exodeoxyribonuclease VII small subunit
VGTEETPGKEMRFEEALARLEELVAALEKGDQPLEETIRSFEEGQRLLRLCAELLGHAELRVKEILRRADETLGTGEWKGEIDAGG